MDIYSTDKQEIIKQLFHFKQKLTKSNRIYRILREILVLRQGDDKNIEGTVVKYSSHAFQINL